MKGCSLGGRYVARRGTLLAKDGETPVFFTEDIPAEEDPTLVFLLFFGLLGV